MEHHHAIHGKIHYFYGQAREEMEMTRVKLQAAPSKAATMGPTAPGLGGLRSGMQWEYECYMSWDDLYIYIFGGFMFIDDL